MIRVSRKTVLALAVLLLVAGTAKSQEQSQSGEALLDVRVTGPKGESIAGLGPGDFTVQEDGKPVEVTGVTFHAERYFLLLFEIPKGKPTTHSPYLQAAQRARKWLQQELRPDDRVAVMSHRGKLELHQDFTQDREALSQAVGAVMTGGKGENPSASPAGSPSLRLPRNPGARTISASLEVLGEALQGIPERKILVLFSAGLDEGQKSEPVPALNNAHVSVYTVNLAGSDNAGRHALRELAEGTGGRFIEHFWSALDQISMDTKGYYRVGFHSAGEPRDIQISVTRPGAVVRLLDARPRQ